MEIRLRKAPTLAQFSLRSRVLTRVSALGIRRVGRSLAGPGGAMLLTLCLMGQTAWAQGEREDEEPAWIPSINFGFDVFDYGTKSTVENNLNPPAQEGSKNGTERQLMFRLGGELLGPRFEGLPGRPRLFAQGGVGLRSLSRDRIFRVGDLRADPQDEINKFQAIRRGEIVRSKCNEPQFDDCSVRDPGDFMGQGSQIDAEFQNPSWNAALGVAFDVPVGNSLLLQVKPSIAYNVDRIDLSGKITTVIETDPVNEVFEVHRDAASGSTTDHSLGLGLELGLDLFRSTRPIRASLYADARFLWMLSDRSTTFEDSLAVYQVRRDSFGIRAGAGVRFSWMGFRSR